MKAFTKQAIEKTISEMDALIAKAVERSRRILALGDDAQSKALSESVTELRWNVDDLRRRYTGVTDTKTGTWYPTRAAAYKAIALEYGLDPTSIGGWMTLIRTDPSRLSFYKAEEWLGR